MCLISHLDHPEARTSQPCEATRRLHSTPHIIIGVMKPETTGVITGTRGSTTVRGLGYALQLVGEMVSGVRTSALLGAC